MSETLYSILGVRQNATKEEIKASYRKLVRVFHPDINKEKGATERFKKLTEAYTTLVSDVERLKYDASLGLHVSSAERFEGKKSKQEFFRENHKKDPKSQKEGAFSKIFHEFFDDIHQKEKTQKPEKAKGEDIYTNITISATEALKGAVRKINVVHSESCPKCGGRKFINGSRCVLCDGAGEKAIHKKLSIKIPPNVKEGMKIRVPNEGKTGKNGGKNGDLYLNVTISKENTFFETKGGETLCNVPIAPWEAVLGANIEVPTPEGKVLMKIPAQTVSGQRFKLVGNGSLDPKTLKRGDLIAVVNIETPKNPSKDELELYEKLKRLDSRNIRGELFEKGAN